MRQCNWVQLEIQSTIELTRGQRLGPAGLLQLAYYHRCHFSKVQKSQTLHMQLTLYLEWQQEQVAESQKCSELN